MTGTPEQAAETSPFHEGERAVQRRTGMRARIAHVEHNLIRDFMPEQHRSFLRELPFLIAGALDEAGWPRASILVGHPGFIDAPDPYSLRVRGHVAHEDPALPRLAAGAPIGLLGIQPETRRRNRANGFVTAAGAHGLDIVVTQSFGNCPKYIQARTAHFIAEPASFAAPRATRAEGPQLSATARELVARADTFFIASAAQDVRGGHAPPYGVDVSHRGGKPGFVKVSQAAGPCMLTWPDFTGNSFFNTLGNLAVNPRAGLLFLDFERGDWLSLAGEVEVIWDGAELAGFPGAERLLCLCVARGVMAEGALPLRWSAAKFSPALAPTGVW